MSHVAPSPPPSSFHRCRYASPTPPAFLNTSPHSLFSACRYNQACECSPYSCKRAEKAKRVSSILRELRRAPAHPVFGASPCFVAHTPSPFLSFPASTPRTRYSAMALSTYSEPVYNQYAY
ncbi:hypothetical protein HYPSUDRAFT_38464 [Hypholoma sublateritium FD-334 SS-4]|uniref:Uncharacterized protein n=1 Tax=Hypholoma sublateritium (strain FD-334 SS-4) TaxID=945553 RepID=A0A0D2LC45_HYPSF|nr:hypothetical protein HYPSUDRAFT_38464 [Hypholoma sublateritium FD-334 SS-4]